MRQTTESVEQHQLGLNRMVSLFQNLVSFLEQAGREECTARRPAPAARIQELTSRILSCDEMDHECHICLSGPSKPHPEPARRCRGRGSANPQPLQCEHGDRWQATNLLLRYHDVPLERS